MRQLNRRGPNPLLQPGDVIPVRIPHELRQRAEEYALKNGLGSFAATVRHSLAVLLANEPPAERSGANA